MNLAGSARRRWRALLFPLAVLAVGVRSMYVGPLPGLGLMLCVGGVFALPIMAFLSP